MGRIKVRYSEAFKLRVVSALESGDVSGIPEAKARFGVGGATTIQRWLRKYGRNHLLPRVLRVETIDDRERLEALKREIDHLKKALADAHMETVLYRSWLEAACEEFGVSDVAAFKKKLAEKQSR